MSESSLSGPPSDPLPTGHATLRAVAMPSDTNPNGDIFGGWLLSQMDLAGGIAAYERAGGRVATVAVNALSFHEPVSVGDVVSCYATVERVGRTSIRVAIETYVRRRDGGHTEKVTEGTFVYVAMDTNGRPRPVGP
ncbi:MAG: acyl-CoA thioesterase [Rhodospirillaceae bacterium]|nr:acyl-CoA thioesterase [Rhodospirillaceae bacterium]